MQVEKTFKITFWIQSLKKVGSNYYKPWFSCQPELSVNSEHLTTAFLMVLSVLVTFLA